MPPKKMNFEESLQKLENIVEQLESGEVELEQSIKKYEEGKDLIENCYSILKNIENRVKKLNIDKEGNAQLSLF
jgi:exodeoxyribonuclease VII small subunit